MPEPERLESLWAGEFGDAYTNRNRSDFALRRHFWNQLLRDLKPKRVLEVGCNACGNLKWLSPAADAYGIDINDSSLRTAKIAWPDLNLVRGTARDLPFRDSFFDLTFTCGVLIHQPRQSLLHVMEEVIRTSRRYVLCMEYYSEKREEVEYRKQEGALFKDNYGAIYHDRFDLKPLQTGKLGKAEGFDDVTWWLMEK